MVGVRLGEKGGEMEDDGVHLQFGCFQLRAVQMSLLKEVKTMDRIVLPEASRDRRAWRNTTSSRLSTKSLMFTVGPSRNFSSSSSVG